MAEEELRIHRNHLDELVKTRTSELEKALEEIKVLQGILPICSFCKKIRGSTDQWEAIESYIANHSDAQFSHSVCPDCLKKNYPDFSDPRL